VHPCYVWPCRYRKEEGGGTLEPVEEVMIEVGPEDRTPLILQLPVGAQR